MPLGFGHLETVGPRAGCLPNQTKPNLDTSPSIPPHFPLPPPQPHTTPGHLTTKGTIYIKQIVSTISSVCVACEADSVSRLEIGISMRMGKRGYQPLL